MTKTEPAQPLQLVLGAVLVLFGAVLVGGSGTLIAALLAGLACVAALVLGRSTGDRIWAVSGFACAAIITVVPPLVREHPQLGAVGILWMFAVVWTTDIAAYFTGRRFGGPKLFPRVSPKKTWSGFAGGLVAGTLAGVAVVAIAQRFDGPAPLSLMAVGVVSAIASILGQIGDLAESALKRRFGVKDSGHLIPGHGGVMDRLDAFWAVAALIGVLLLAQEAGR